MIRARLTLIVTLTIGMLAAPLTTGAQPSTKIPRIGVFQIGTSAVHAGPSPEALSTPLERWRERIAEPTRVSGPRLAMLAPAAERGR